MRYVLLMALALTSCSHGVLVTPNETGWMDVERGIFWPFLVHDIFYCVATDASKAPAPVCYAPVYAYPDEWLKAGAKAAPSR